ncbi:hypothetical protein [Pseudomonas sp. DWP3-1-2]|uniref:hypothetical protein n=1 Tax=Pseudomonas sp. DWP3-1-2 TaxID=2804645 RepID=UPI003CEEE6C4
MLNGLEWKDRHPDFFSESQALLSRSQECLSHLGLIDNDQDAVECLMDSLHKLGNLADTASVECIANFTRQLLAVLDTALRDTLLPGNSLQVLQDCFALLAWQLELIDPSNGLLLLDDSEQRTLVEDFASAMGVGTLANGGQPSRPANSGERSISH